MPKHQSLAVFDSSEFHSVRELLAAKVAYMMGRKFEEGDWAEVYCAAKNIRIPDWSNLHVDIEVPGLALEQKMLKKEDSRSVREYAGTWLMHPSLTRQVSLSERDTDPNRAMRKVVSEYQRVLDSRRARAEAKSGGRPVEMRSGWLVYQSSLREFLYFEEETCNLDPNEHYAAWAERNRSGSRRGSRNLWVYNRRTGQKVWSVTGAGSGTKIQPYFLVPPADDPNVYFFRAQGEIEDGLIKVWLTLSTYQSLEGVLRSLSPEAISQAILEAKAVDVESPADVRSSAVRVVKITQEAYERLRTAFAGASDEHSFQLLLRSLIVD